MKKPDPEVGQIIRFDYLWRDEAERGRIQGAKERPCAVIIALRREADGSQRVFLAPVTHSPPQKGQSAIEVPARFSAMTGLDESRSWLVVSEVNRVDWRDPGIVPAKSGELFLKINEPSNGLSDNSGVISVEILDTSR